MLKHEPHLTVAHRHAGHVLVAEQNLALVGELQPGNHPQQGGFARSRGAQQRNQLTAFNVEVNAVQRLEGAEVFFNVADVDVHGDAPNGGQCLRPAANSSPYRHSRKDLAASVTSARLASSEATAKAAAKAYSL